MKPAEVEVSGVIEKIVFRNHDNGFHILSVALKQEVGASIVTVNQVNIKEGMSLKFSGTWIEHQKFGRQFKAIKAEEVMPDTAEGLQSYLASDFFFGIGPVIANRIIKHFGAEKVIEIFNNNIDRLREVKGVSKKKLDAIKKGWEENKQINEIMVFLQNYGISTLLSVKIYRTYGKDCITTIQNNPYILANDIEGIGFVYADKIAMELGIKKDSDIRVEAGLKHVLAASESDGHCFLRIGQIISESFQLLKINDKDVIIKNLNKLESKDEIKTISLYINDEKRYYTNRIYYNEDCCVNRIRDLLKSKVDFDNESLEKWADSNGSGTIILSDEQIESIKGIVKNPISVLTGGAGCGKCLAKGTVILMFDGTKKKVEDVIVGDLLMGNDSTPRKVLSLARGKERMYEIFSSKDKKIWGCNESHIISLRYGAKKPTIYNGKRYCKGDVLNISVKDYINLSTYLKKHFKQYCAKIDYKKQPIPLPPYLLGIWLGDGDSDGSRITNIDEEIVSYCKEVAIELNFNCKVTYPKNRTQTILFSGKRKNNVVYILKNLNLIKNKHIPKSYLINSENNRLELLAGLLDSDGHLRKNGGFEITLKSEMLIDNIVDLASSLGFRAIKSSKIASMKRKDGSYYYCKVFRLSIDGNVKTIPTKIKRKKANSIPRCNSLHSGIKIINKGEGEYYGFEIDGNKLFVLGNYVVTHNTTVTYSLVKYLESLNKKIYLAAPTGRAAKRMTEVIGREAMTIHRLLIWNPFDEGFTHNERNPLNADFLIIDESSMIDINLAASLLIAIPDNCQVLFIGDANQLPPVGAGMFFKDLIESGKVNVYKLNKIFRQGKGSDIIKYAHEINEGNDPDIQSPLMDPQLWNGGTDCLFIDSGISEPYTPQNEYPKWSSLRYGMDVIGMIKKLYVETIPKYMGADKEIQILCPMNVGELGTIKINEIIQAVINPPSFEKAEIKIKERIFRVGDRVIQKVNNYDLAVFNGDIGKISYIDKARFEAIIKFGTEERPVEYKRENLLEIDLAYAVSVHKSQGSEFDVIIVSLMPQYGGMLQKNLLYTAVTRGKKMVVIVGTRKAMQIAVKNVTPNLRQTSLRELLIGDEAMVLTSS